MGCFRSVSTWVEHAQCLRYAHGSQCFHADMTPMREGSSNLIESVRHFITEERMSEEYADMRKNFGKRGLFNAGMVTTVATAAIMYSSVRSPPEPR